MAPSPHLCVVDASWHNNMVPNHLLASDTNVQIILNRLHEWAGSSCPWCVLLPSFLESPCCLHTEVETASLICKELLPLWDNFRDIRMLQDISNSTSRDSLNLPSEKVTFSDSFDENSFMFYESASDTRLYRDVCWRQIICRLYLPCKLRYYWHRTKRA